MLDAITAMSAVRIKYPQDLTKLDARQSVMRTIATAEAQFKPDPLPLLDPVKDMNIKVCVVTVEALPRTRSSPNALARSWRSRRCSSHTLCAPPTTSPTSTTNSRGRSRCVPGVAL